MYIRDMYGFIYITTNLVNGKKYIGQKKLRPNRVDTDINSYLGSGIVIKQAIDKYGRENFIKDIVAIAYNKEELDNLEREFIKFHNAVESYDYYNVSEGGEGNNTKGKNHCSSIKVICLNTNKIFDCIEEAKIFYNAPRISSVCKGDLLTSGKSEDGTKLAWMYYDDYLKASELEIQNKLSNSKYIVSDETKKKQSNKRHGSNNGNAKKVICVTTNEIFDTMLDGANKYHANKKCISHCCRKKQKTSGIHPVTKSPLAWMYYDEYLEKTL
jgi:group I intron endonuclease